MNNSTCWLFETPLRAKVVETIAYVSYFWIWPLCLLFDFVGHTICFVAFYKEHKSHNVYSFQLFDAIAKATDTLTAFLMLSTLFWFCGLNYSGVEWFQRSYGLMWYSAHLAIPLNDMTTTISLLTSMFMTVDRAIGIGMPYKYKNMNRKLWEGGSMAVTVVIGVACSLFVCPYFNIEQDPETDLYLLSFNSQWVSSPLAKGLATLRNILWITGLIILVVSGFLVVLLFKRNSNKVSDMMGEKSAKKRRTEKTLFVLTVYYSLQMMNEMIILIAHTFLGELEDFQACAGRLFTPIRAMEIGFVNGSDFYIMLLLSKAFRELVRRALRRKPGLPASTVAGTVPQISVPSVSYRHNTKVVCITGH